MTCKHQRGDTIHGIWVCADCFKPLMSRPVRYHMALGLGVRQGRGERQEIAWQADFAKDDDGVRFGKFVLWMVGYLRSRSLFTVTKDEARQQCLDVLRDMGEPFGSNGACWDREDAKELVREAICAYWDEGPAGANS